MRVLYLCREFPWPLQNGNVKRTFALLRALATKHEVILSSQSAKGINQHLPYLKDLIQDFIPAPAEGSSRCAMPSLTGPIEKCSFYASDLFLHRVPYRFRFISEDWANCLRKTVNEVDAIFCRHTYMTSLIDRKKWSKLVLDADDLFYRQNFQEMRKSSGLKKRLYYGAIGLRYFLYEQSVFRQVARTTMSSHLDCQSIRSDRKSIIPNGVFMPNCSELGNGPEQGAIGMIAHFGYDPNVKGLRWFMEQVWPCLSRKCTLKAYVVGLKASPEMLPFADVPGVEIIGPVADVYPWFERSVVTIVPLWKGTGTRIKVLESLACGRPVVSTTLGAEGLEELGPEQGLFRADSPQAMADAISGLVSDQDRALEIGAQGQKYIKGHYTWEQTTALLPQAIGGWVR